MRFKTLLVHLENDISIITIDRPKKLNALNKETISELHYAIKESDANKNVRAIILTGNGEKAFVAGADISEFSDFDVQQAAQLSREGQMLLFDFIENLSTPVIAAINGYALGGGLELAMACHIRIGSENSLMGLPEVSLGVTPGYGGTQRLPQLIGKGRAMELILSAQMINAERAEKIGLLNHVTTLENLMDFTQNIASKIIKNSTSAIGASIKCINSNFKDGENGYLTEIQEFSNCFETEDFIEGTNAFLNKQKPRFK